LKSARKRQDFDKYFSFKLYDYLSENENSFNDPNFLISLEIFVAKLNSHVPDFHLLSESLDKLGPIH